MIVGHGKVRSELNKALERGVLSQAYILIGPEAVGKFSVALEFAAKINDAHGNFDSDLVTLSPQVEEIKGVEKKKRISVEEIRNLQRMIVTAPNQGKHRIVIINDAEFMTKGAQNALLKTLEEAPQNTVLMLVTSDPTRILPTVLSRCQAKKFSILSDEEMKELVAPENRNADEMIFWSFGRPGWAKEMLEDESKLDEKKEMLLRLKRMVESDLGIRFDLAEGLSKDVPSLCRELGIWAAVLRESVLGSAMLSISKEKALEIIEAIDESKRTIENTNANTRLVLENLFLRF